MLDLRNHKATRLARRDILKLGLMSPIMAGIGTRLIGEARGATPHRQVLITLVSGSAFPNRQANLTRAKVDEFIGERLTRDPNLFAEKPGLEATWNGYYDRFDGRGMLPDSIMAIRSANSDRDPSIVESILDHRLDGPLAPFEARKDRLLYFSRLFATGGVEERGGWSHGGGMRVLTAHGTGRIPRGASIDQHIAQVIGEGMSERSIRISVDRHSASSFKGKVDRFQNFKVGHFAAGNETALPGYANPLMLFADLFGTEESDGMDDGDLRRELRARMFDHLSSDIRRLSGQLAGTEREKLDVLLGEIEQFSAAQQARVGMSCASPGEPAASLLTAGGHAHATFMIELGALAVRCGLTNVLSVAIGAQPGSHEPMWAHGGYPMGHNIMHYGSCYQFWEDYMALLARVLDDFDTVDNGNGRTLADDTAVMMMGDCGVCNYGQHVAEMKPRWIGCGPDFPIALIAPKGRMRGGTFFQYPSLRRVGVAEGATSQASVYRTLGEVMGAPGFEGHELCHTRTLTEALV